MIIRIGAVPGYGMHSGSKPAGSQGFYLLPLHIIYPDGNLLLFRHGEGDFRMPVERIGVISDDSNCPGKLIGRQRLIRNGRVRGIDIREMSRLREIYAFGI